MEKEELYRDLAALLKRSAGARGGVVLSRGEDELERLAGWLCVQDRAHEAARDDDLKKLVEECNRCPGVEEKKFGIGSGSNRVMVILNSPQLVNMVEKKVLKKDSVDLLKKIVQSAGLAFGECYITNLVKCDVNDPRLNRARSSRTAITS